jgi:DNA-binding NarL/FixJ family response regulator
MKTQERIVILTRSSKVAEALGGRIKRDTCTWVMATPEPGNEAELNKIIQDNNPTLIFIDGYYEEQDRDSMEHLSTQQSAFLEELMTDLKSMSTSELITAHKLPISMLIMKQIQRIRQNLGMKELLVFYFVDDPSIELTQELCRQGANWVWPHRVSPTTMLDQVIERLRIVFRHPLVDAIAKCQPRLLIVDNSAAECNRLYAELSDIAAITYAGADLPADSDIPVAEVLKVFNAGSYDGIIMDLGLYDSEEKQAKEMLQGNDNALKHFVASSGTEDKRFFLEVVSGLVAIQKIREINKDIPILIFTVMVRTASVVAMMKLFLGDAIYDSLRMFPKGEPYYLEVRKWALKLTR